MSIKDMVNRWLKSSSDKKEEVSDPDFPSSTYQTMIDMNDTNEEEAKKWEAFSKHISERCSSITVGKGGTGCSHGRRWILDDYERLFTLIAQSENPTLSFLSKEMDRSVGSIMSRLDSLRLTEWIFCNPYLSGNPRSIYAMRNSHPEKSVQWSEKVLVFRFHLKICGVPVNLTPLAIKTGLATRSEDRKFLILPNNLSGKRLHKGEIETK